MITLPTAFSTVACPDWTLAQVAQRASEMGYDAVELRTMGPAGSDGTGGLASDPALSEPAKVKQILADAGIEPLCLSTSYALHHKSDSDARSAHWLISKAIEDAAAIGCRYLRLFGNAVGPGESHRGVIQRIAERVGPLADKAGDAGVTLLFENDGSFAVAKEWWWLLNLLEHPMVGMLWNPANAAAAGESVTVSVPMLNHRIKLARILDTRVGEGVGFLPPGQGNVGMETYVKRLLGVGYRGHLLMHWPRLSLPGLAPADEFLPAAHQWAADLFQTIEDARDPKAAAKRQKEEQERKKKEDEAKKADEAETKEAAAASAAKGEVAGAEKTNE
jgi:sugar phosphate isomerase/epimerase